VGRKIVAKKKSKAMWTWAPGPQKKAKLPDALKKEAQTKANDLVERVLKPAYLKPPPENAEWNYPIDIWTKWHGSFFYFGSTWVCPAPNRITATFEERFARMDYMGDHRFTLAYFRHTGQWCVIHSGLTLDDCLELIGEGGPFTLI
jgi:hypothetical protein